MLDDIQEFLSTSQEMLLQLEHDAAVLPENPCDIRALVRMRSMLDSTRHTAATLGFDTLEEICQLGSQFLERCAQQQIELNQTRLVLLQDLLAAIANQVEHIAVSGIDSSDGSDVETLLFGLDRELSATTGNVTNEVDGDLPDKPLPGRQAAPVELDDEMKEVLKDFLQECYENLDRVDSELLELEEQPENRDLLSSIFRSIHTIKGTCGFFGFDKLESLTHEGESLLVKLRDGHFALSETMATCLLELVDAIRSMLRSISEQGHDGDQDYVSLLRQLNELKTHGEIISSAETGSSEQQPAIDKSEVEKNSASKSKSDPDGDIQKSDSGAGQQPVIPAGSFAESMVESSVRVDVPVLDSLMNLVGELVLARNQIVEFAGMHENSQISAAAQRLNLITSELQEGVMKTRMQPIHSIWSKLPRIVRDLSRICGKQVRVEMIGKSTELDKSLIEAIKDPITHLLRNAIDHGIETPQQRLAAGKPAEGVLMLRAFHEGGQVHIEISDDGGGIDPDKVRNKVLESGLLSKEQAEAMSDQEMCKQIFRAGFSTVEVVTNISGRGVGMDVVKNNIEKISGSIELFSSLGRGTIFKIRMPLTLAIVPALIVTTVGQRFAIPQINLIELIRIDLNEESKAIEYIHGRPLYRLRGRLLPLISLQEELKLGSMPAGAMNIVVLEADKCRYGLVVDQINDTQEIVVKPLAEVLKSISVYSGATIMGDGQVALILDPTGLAQRAGVFNTSQEQRVRKAKAHGKHSVQDSEPLLLVSMAGDSRLAIPLNQVARLEQIDMGRMEYAGNRLVVQYRGQLLPLVQLSDYLVDRRIRDKADGVPLVKRRETNEVQIVVFGDEGRQFGLIVEDIIDVVDEVLQARGQASRAGILGTAAIRGKVTELFDVEAFIESSSAIESDVDMVA